MNSRSKERKATQKTSVPLGLHSGGMSEFRKAEAARIGKTKFQRRRRCAEVVVV